MDADTDPWVRDFPPLEGVRDVAWQGALEQIQEVRVPARTVIFRAGDPCTHYLFVRDGSVRVSRLTPEGREIVLYHVGPGCTCVLTTACLLGNSGYPAEGVADRAVRAMRMPAPVFRRLLRDSEGFRDFVFAELGGRMVRLMERVQEQAFDRTGVRLARLLVARAGADDRVAATHAELAVELGTAREVVSRQLKGFERAGFIRLGRGTLWLLDRVALTPPDGA